MKRVITILLVLLTSIYSAEIPFENEIKQCVLNYAQSIGCTEYDPEDPSSFDAIFLENGIFTLKVTKENHKIYSDGEYIVLFIADIGCQGGNQSLSFNVARVKEGANKHFYVDPKNSSPVLNTHTAWMHINKIVSFKNGILTVENATYKKNDPQCCPSRIKRTRFKLHKDGGFSLIH